MRNLSVLAAGLMFGAVLLGAGPANAQEVRSGKELARVCEALLDREPERAADGERCKEFLVSMIRSQESTLTIGQPFRAERLGPKEDESACFQLPDKLPFIAFAGQVVVYANDHPEVVRRSARELASRSLAQTYPCSEAERQG